MQVLKRFALSTVKRQKKKEKVGRRKVSKRKGV